MNQTVRQFCIILFVTLLTLGTIFIFFPQFMLIIFTLFELLSILLSIYIVFRRTDVTSVKIAWVLTLYFVPIVGLFLYLFFGRKNLKSNAIQKREQEALIYYVQNLETKDLEHLSNVEEKNKQLSGKAVLGGNRFDVLTDGEETFTAIFSALNKAEHHIHLFYFIIKEDELADKLRNILIRKAAEGVQVRFGVDGLGSVKLSDEYLDSLKAAQIEVEIFNPIRSFYHIARANWRNHRKVIVIDGKVGFTGGLNVGNEYLGITSKFSHWRDTHLQVTGALVTELQEAFLYDWLYMKNSHGSASEFMTEDYFPIIEEGNDEGQVIYGGPYDQERVVRDVLFNLMDSATEKISIASPYFVPDDEMLALLRRVARNGIKVEIIIPGKGDRKLSYYGNDFYLEALVSAGIHVYKYDNTAFLHCKIMIIDEKVATIGSTNFDIRSFDINHEVSAILYSGQAIQKLTADFKKDKINARKITALELAQRSTWQKIKGKICGLFAPLL
ncbi:cardiolipin synthase [Enterococcus sp. 7F3_DIV0205]|uniref:Cardiolipin synthase n=1 Tax=Candidatus Enterococcus palustris TaxID=1834189 RepID=A0AAQ3Y890_9ENTE|nr:cardiolipin synthase [Enterococcus sp. 7F3_DIV0205]OTN83396.1 cardiolipin synthase [Enterococcus sp. 7F3_DIV0205]